MGLIWAAGMAGVGGFIELLDNILPGGLPGADAVDMWPQTLMIPGFLGGVIFSVVVMIAAGRRRFDELSIPGFTAMGVVGGLLLGAWGVSGGLPAFVLGVTALGGGIGAASSLTLARWAAKRESLSAPLPEAGIAGGSAPPQLKGRDNR
jgi:hypothetical protein